MELQYRWVHRPRCSFNGAKSRTRRVLRQTPIDRAHQASERSSALLKWKGSSSSVLSGVFCELRRSFYLRVFPRTIAVLYVGLRCHDRGRRRDGACAAARLVGETFGVSM